MKNIKFIFALVCLTVCSFAPVIATAQRDSIKHIALGLEVNTMGSSPYVDFNSILFYGYTGYSGEAGATSNKSYSFGVRSCIDLSHNFSLKIRAGIRSSNVSVTITDTSGGKSQAVLNETQSSYYLVTGCQQNISINKFTHLHVGLDFDFTYYADLLQNLSFTQTYYNYYYYGTSTTYTQTESYKTPGGVTFGIGPALGFDFKLGKSIALGSEATIALLYETMGGKQTYTETNSMGNPPQQRPYNFSLTTSGWTDSGIIASVYLQLTL